MKGLRIQLFFCVFGLSVGCESSSIPDRGLVVEPRRVALDCAQLDPCEATVTLTNVTEDIVSGAWALLSEQGPGFSLVQGDQSFRMLGAGESEVSRRTFTVRLDPQADVERAVVRVSYERAGVAQPPIDVPVTRRDIGDAVLEVASQLRLPGGRPGERITAELELRNAGIGNVALFVREVQVDDPQVEVSFAEALPVRIGVGESVRATVAWTPLSATFLETKIRINPNDVSFVRRAVVDLVGTTLEGAIIGTEQAQVDFGDMGGRGGSSAQSDRSQPRYHPSDGGREHRGGRTRRAVLGRTEPDRGPTARVAGPQSQRASLRDWALYLDGRASSSRRGRRGSGAASRSGVRTPGRRAALGVGFWERGGRIHLHRHDHR